MPTFSAWLGTSDLGALPTVTKANRAALAWRRINDKPSSITFRKPDGTDLVAQTVRLEWDNQASAAESEAGAVATRKLIIFGIRDHATQANTDIGDGYRFAYLNDAYTVMDTIVTLGEVQAVAEAVG